MQPRERIIILSEVGLILSGTFLLPFFVLWGVDAWLFDLDTPGQPASLFGVIAFVLFIISIMVIGALVGAFVWVLLLKSFFSREELRPCFADMYVPYVTEIVLKIFDFIYPPEKV